MQNIQITMDKLPNLQRLHKEIMAQLGPTFVGLSGRGRHLVVHLEQNATREDVDTVNTIVESHDPTQLTVEQQKIRQLEIDRISELDDPLDVSAYDAKDATIQRLARKIAWLEREIASLRTVSPDKQV